MKPYYQDMKNEDKIILDLCGGTGAWSQPYADAGYDIRIITLPSYDVRDYQPTQDVYGILAAPPCTEFSIARQKNRYMKETPKRDLEAGMEIVNACKLIIRKCEPMFWVIENPVGLLSTFLGRPNYIFHPWMFGDPWTKRTALWGNFNKPLEIYQSPQDCIASLGTELKSYFRERKLSASFRGSALLPSKADIDRTCFRYVGMREERSAFRAVTPSGFANAFYKVNK